MGIATNEQGYARHEHSGLAAHPELAKRFRGWAKNVGMAEGLVGTRRDYGRPEAGCLALVGYTEAEGEVGTFPFFSSRPGMGAAEDCFSVVYRRVGMRQPAGDGGRRDIPSGLARGT